ncbi:MAG: hypothetical protein ACRENC_06700, partial [Gemmatimonadaceae bacterium]
MSSNTTAGRILREPLHAAAPQSAIEVEAVVLEMRMLDERFDIGWEPRAVLVQRGSYDALGKMVDPIYRGLWEVRLYDPSQRTTTWREWVRVCLVTEPVRIAAGMTAMQDDGP